MDAIEQAITNSIADLPPDDTDTPDIQADAPDDAGDATPEVSADTPPAEAATEAAGETPAEEKPADPNDFDSMPERDANGRINRIPHTRVKELVSKRMRQEAQAEFETTARTSLGLAGDTPIDFAQIGEKLKVVEQQTQQMQAFEKLFAEQPAEFVKFIVEQNPAYKEYLREAKEEAAAAQREAPADEPQPDIDLGDGRRTYSPAGLKKLVAWERQQAVKEAEEKITKRFAPIEQQFRVQETGRQAEARVKKLMAEARTWDGFSDHEADILTELRKNPQQSLDEAYRKVVVPKFKADKAAIEAATRKKVLEELNAKPKSTAVAASGATPAVTVTGDPVEAAIRAAMKNLE